jgi:ferredoxin-NADP reductase
VVSIRAETVRVRTLVLDVPDFPVHQAGQHVSVRLTAEDGYRAQRDYSIASPPGAAHLELTIERLSEGEVSTYLTDVVRERDLIEVRGPIGGYFVWTPETERPLGLIAGGSGIVPLMSMLRYRATRRAAAKSVPPARLVYSARSAADLIYRAELDALAESDPDLQVAYTLTRSRPADFTGYTRRIDRSMLAETLWSPSASPVLYVCGSTPMVESVATLLVELGHAPADIRTERFGPTG